MQSTDSHTRDHSGKVRGAYACSCRCDSVVVECARGRVSRLCCVGVGCAPFIIIYTYVQCTCTCFLRPLATVERQLAFRRFSDVAHEYPVLICVKDFKFAPLLTALKCQNFRLRRTVHDHSVPLWFRYRGTIAKTLPP